MGPLFLLIALILFVAPIGLVSAAYRNFEQEATKLPHWRTTLSRLGLTGAAINCALMVTFFVTHNVVIPLFDPAPNCRVFDCPSFRAERAIEMCAVALSIACFCLALTAIRKVRFSIAIASVFSCYLWVAALSK